MADHKHVYHPTCGCHFCAQRTIRDAVRDVKFDYGRCPGDRPLTLADAYKGSPRLKPLGPVAMPEDNDARKALPIVTGVLDYFPDALLSVAKCSLVANEQHNKGEPLHWSKEKSTDEVNTMARHLLQRGSRDTDGIRHSAKAAWRALANLQREIEQDALTNGKTDY